MRKMIVVVGILQVVVLVIVVTGLLLVDDKSLEQLDCEKQGGVWRGGWVTYHSYSDKNDDWEPRPSVRAWETTCWWKANG